MHDSNINLVGFESESPFSQWLKSESIKYTESSCVVKSKISIINSKNYKGSKKDYLGNEITFFLSKNQEFKYSIYNKLKPQKIFEDIESLKNYIKEDAPSVVENIESAFKANWLSQIFNTSTFFDFMIAIESIKVMFPEIQSVGLVDEKKKNSFFVNKKSFNVSWTETPASFLNDNNQLQNFFSTKLGRVAGLINYIDIKSCGFFIEGNISSYELKKIKNFLTSHKDLIAHKINELSQIYMSKKESLLWQIVFETLSDPAALLKGEEVLSSNRAYEGLVDNKKYQEKKYLIDKKKDVYFIRYESIEASRRLHQKALQQEKMAALGSVAGQIAHALNNPLTGILSMSQVLQRKHKDKEVSQDLKEVEKAAQRCNSIVQNLRSYSNDSSKEENILMDAVTVLKDTMSFVKVEVGKYKYSISYADSPCIVKVNPQLLQQIFFNLIINATHAVGKGGQIDIGVYSKEKKMIFYVKDNGEGMSPEIQEKIFEPFFTTKIKDKGTGLGLSLVKDIVKSFKGEIKVKSKLGSGSLFEILLPESDFIESEKNEL